MVNIFSKNDAAIMQPQWCSSFALLCWKYSKAAAIGHTALISFEHPWVEQHSSQAQQLVFALPGAAVELCKYRGPLTTRHYFLALLGHHD